MEFNINSLNHINDGNINHVNYDLGDNSNNFDKVRCIKMMISNLTEYIILLFSFIVIMTNSAIIAGAAALIVFNFDNIKNMLGHGSLITTFEFVQIIIILSIFMLVLTIVCLFITVYLINIIRLIRKNDDNEDINYI